MPETVERCTIRARFVGGKGEDFAYLTAKDADPKHIQDRGSIMFSSLEEVKAAIRELKKLLPAVDQLAEVADVP